MRRLKLAALMMILVLLSACGGDRTRETFEALRQGIESSGSVTLTACVIGNLADSVEEYTLSMNWSAEGAVIEVLQPELIAGVRARIGAESDSVEYDGAILAVGRLSEGGLSPVTAMPELIAAINDAHAETFWTEGEHYAVSLVPDDELRITLWLDAQGLPVAAEFINQADGLVLLRCDISEFNIQ